jgi:membrane protein DedA with SNARE-associated domain
MPNASPTAVLDRIDGHASWLLVLASLGTLMRSVLGEDTPVTAAFEILLVFVSGIVLGIIWIRLALRRLDAGKEP